MLINITHGEYFFSFSFIIITSFKDLLLFYMINLKIFCLQDNVLVLLILFSVVLSSMTC